MIEADFLHILVLLTLKNAPKWTEYRHRWRFGNAGDSVSMLQKKGLFCVLSVCLLENLSGG